MSSQVIQNADITRSHLPISQLAIEKKEEPSSNITRIKHFIGGAAVFPLNHAISESINFLTKYFKVIPEDPCFFWNDFRDTLQKQSGVYQPQLDVWKDLVTNALLAGGIGEELIFRGVLQDLLLTKLLGKVIKKVSPTNASWIDTTTAKIFRITLTAALFAGMHLITLTDEIPSGIKYQAFCAFPIGIILGAIKESRLGLIGSIGCHMIHNAVAVGQIYVQCIPNEVELSWNQKWLGF